jgi:hypothetical protein
MAPTPDASNRFVLEVFDRTLWCPTAQAPFYPTDIGPLRSILGLEAAGDPELKCVYYLDDDESAAIVSAFGTFDPRQLDDDSVIEVLLYRLPGTIETPYLVHTNWELPLLLEGRKKLAHFLDAYPTSDAYTAWVRDREEATAGQVTVEPQYDELDGFVRGIAWAKRGERWCAIDRRGRAVPSIACADAVPVDLGRGRCRRRQN